jgi:prepilin-type N-terminal cleavage/methylation domain-containing protein
VRRGSPRSAGRSFALEQARSASSAARRARRGLTLLEIVIALSILTVVMVGFVQGLVSTRSLSNAGREGRLSREAIRQVLEDMQSQPFAEIFARYNADPGDDPGVGPSPGATFDVGGLTPRPDDADGLVGEILFPTDDVDVGILREDLEILRLDTPRDLNADGAIDEFDHSGDYRLLPVLVRVAWRGASGDAQQEVVTFLADR